MQKFLICTESRSQFKTHSNLKQFEFISVYKMCSDEVCDRLANPSCPSFQIQCVSDILRQWLLCFIYAQPWTRDVWFKLNISCFWSTAIMFPSFAKIGPSIGPQWFVIGSSCCDWMFQLPSVALCWIAQPCSSLTCFVFVFFGQIFFSFLVHDLFLCGE